MLAVIEKSKKLVQMLLNSGAKGGKYDRVGIILKLLFIEVSR